MVIPVLEQRFFFCESGCWRSPRSTRFCNITAKNE